MRRPTATLLVGTAALATFVAPPRSLRAQSAGPTAGDPISVITISGSGEARVTPDRARLSIGVQTQAPTAADASVRNARLQRAVVDTLRSLGLGADQITTSGYNVSPEQTYDPQGRRARITGYTVQNTVVVELRRIDQVGPALDAVLSKGANVVSSLQFYSSQAEAVNRQALQNAVARARQDAEALATAAGGRLGELLELSSGAIMRPPPVYAMMEARMAGRAADASAPTPISEGEQTVTAAVTGRWRFISATPAAR
jgi:uncharacterized protein YggE